MALDPASKVVQVGERDIVQLHTKLRHTTVIVLPKEEKILDYVCGDKEFWVINGAANFAYVHPSKQGAQTNLNLITESGNVYSFLLTEGDLADLKVFVELKDTGMITALGKARFVSVDDVHVYEKRALAAERQAVKEREAAEVRIIQAQAAAEQKVQQYKAEYPKTIRSLYTVERDKSPFNVQMMWTDGFSTFVNANPLELFVVYELKDGKPNLIEFKPVATKDGFQYRTDKVLGNGYFKIGKQESKFYIQGS